MTKRICLGKITNAHGIKGLVKVMPFGGDPKLIETLGPVFTDETGDDTLTIIMKNSAGNKAWLAQVEGVADRNTAEALRGTMLYANQDALPKIEDENVFYHIDLDGMRVLDETNTEIGHVFRVDNFGAGDLLDIRLKTGKSFYLPFNDTYVVDVDMENKQILTRNARDVMMD